MNRRTSTLVIGGNNCYTTSRRDKLLSALDYGMLRPFVEAWNGPTELLALATPTDRRRDFSFSDDTKVCVVASQRFSRGFGRLAATPVIFFRAFVHVLRAGAVYARLPSPMGTLMLSVAALARKPTFCSIHGAPPYKSRRSSVMRTFRKLCGRLLIDRCTVTFVTNPELLTTYGVTHSYSAPIRTTLIEGNVSPSPIPRSFGGDLRLGFVGRLSEEKNPLLLYEICDALNRRGFRVRLEIVGSGPMEAQVRERAANACYDIKLHGWIDDRDVLIRTIRSFDYLLIPSFAEGNPKVLLEAMAVGVPALIKPHNVNVKELLATGGAIAVKSLESDDWVDALLNTWRSDVYPFVSRRAVGVAAGFTIDSLTRQIARLLDARLS